MTNRQQTTDREVAGSHQEQGGQQASAERALGRPPGTGSDRVREDLLAAARQLFLSYEFKAVSVRQIASQAGVNGAMVNYYFGGKKGLYLAMVEDVFSALEKPMKELNAHGRESVREFIAGYMNFLASNPWWPNFVIREVMFGEEEIRQSIIEKVSATFARGLIGAVDGEIKSGRYRPDLEPELATWSLLGMMVFPFLSRPIASHIFGQELDGSAVTRLIAHTCELFEHGVAEQERQA